LVEKAIQLPVKERRCCQGAERNCWQQTSKKPKEDQVLKLLKSVVLKRKAGWNEVVRSGRLIASLSQLKSICWHSLNLQVGLPQALRSSEFGHWGPSLPVELLSTWNGSLERLEKLSETFS